MPSMFAHRPRPWLAAILIGAILGGLGLRMLGLELWIDHPERLMFDYQGRERPILLAIDGYYYLDLARDLLDGTYDISDPSRNVPQGDVRPYPPPLLSLITAWFAAASQQPLEWIALLLPPLLGVMVALPVYLLGRDLGGRVHAAIAVLFALLAPYLFQRSGVGWFDTDALNVTFSLLASAIGLRVTQAANARARAGWLLLGLVNAGLFMLWWHTQPLLPLALALAPPAIGLLLAGDQTRTRRLTWLGGLTLAGLLVAIMVQPKLLSIEHIRNYANLLKLVAGDAAGAIFPKGGTLITELQAPEFDQLVKQASGHLLVFLAGLLGLAGLLIRHRARLLVLATLMALGAFSLIAERFAVFLGPLLALGLGYLGGELFVHARKLSTGPRHAASVILILLLGLAAWPSLQASLAATEHMPRWQPGHFQGFTKLAEVTEPDAAIWTAWDHGYPLHLYSRRATLGDGRFNRDHLPYVLNHPLTMPDARQAANWIHFYVARGTAGLNALADRRGGMPAGIDFLQRVMAAGPGQAGQLLLSEHYAEADQVAEQLAFFFPADSRPVYLLITDLWANYPWYEVGAWDFDQRRRAKQLYRTYGNLHNLQSSNLVRGYQTVDHQWQLEVDTHNGRFSLITPGQKQSNRLSRLTIGFQSSRFQPGPFELSIREPDKLALLQRSNTRQTTLNKLFFERNWAFYQQGFERVEDQSPSYQIWRVLPSRN